MTHIRTITVAPALVAKQGTEPTIFEFLVLLAQILDLVQTILLLLDKFLPLPMDQS